MVVVSCWFVLRILGDLMAIDVIFQGRSKWLGTQHIPAAIT